MSPGDAGSTPPLGVTPPAVILHPAGSAGGVQSFWQLSLLTSLPSSHSSLPFLMPSPQKTQPLVPHVAPVRQGPWVEGAVDGKAAPSHVSHVWLMMPSPHVGSMQLLRQLSVSMLLPSSHCSPPLTMPSPQKVQLSVPHVFPVRQAPSARQRAAPCC